MSEARHTCFHLRNESGHTPCEVYVYNRDEVCEQLTVSHHRNKDYTIGCCHCHQLNHYVARKRDRVCEC